MQAITKQIHERMTLPTSEGGTKKYLLDAAITGTPTDERKSKNFKRNWKKLIEQFDLVAQTIDALQGYELQFIQHPIQRNKADVKRHQPAALAQLLKIHNCTQIMSVIAADNQYKLLLIKR